MPNRALKPNRKCSRWNGFGARQRKCAMRDARALAAIFDDSLTYVHMDGRLMTKPEVLADARKLAPVEIVVDSRWPENMETS